MKKNADLGIAVGASALAVLTLSLSLLLFPDLGRCAPSLRADQIPLSQLPAARPRGQRSQGRGERAGQLSLLTLASTEEIGGDFGQSAILHTPEEGEPVLYQLDAIEGESSWLSMLRGHVLIEAKRRPYQPLLKRWRRQGRAVVSAPIQLSPRLTRLLLAELETATRSRFRRRWLDPLKGNGSTGLRDLFDQLTRGGLYRAGHAQGPYRSYRADMRRGYRERWGAALIIELLFGTELERPQTLWALSYRAESLYQLLKRVKLQGRALVGPQRKLVQGRNAGLGGARLAQIFLLSLGLIFLLCALWWAGSGRRRLRLLLVVISLSSALLSLAVCALMLSSAWAPVRASTLPLFISPFDLFVGLAAFSRARMSTDSIPESWWWARRYLTLRLILLIPTALFLTVTLGPVPMTSVLLALFLLLAQRACLQSA
ncbi:MAG: hypothetical protein VYD19_10865 [Myxococcota bacterium]|nr:hypothetical protein [Myxococcota bacterium]